MAENIKGITIEFKGDSTSLGKALKDIKTQASGVDKDLKAVNRALKFNPGNTELIAQKQQLLKTKVQQTKDSLDALKAAQKTLDAEGVDKSSSEYMTLRRRIIETESQLKHFDAELKKLDGAKLRALGEEFSKTGKKMQSIGKGMTTYVTAPVAAGFAGAIKSASDFNENVNKVEVAFGKSKSAVMNWAKTATTEFGLSKNAALEAAALFGDMGTSMGLSKTAAADMSTSLAGLAGDLASFKNISVDEAMTALKGVFTGETESLKNLGVVMTETNLQKFAADQGLVYDSMSEAEKVTLRYQYVLEKTKNAQGDYAKTNDQTANALRTFQGAVSNLSTAFGQHLLPIINPIILKVTELINKFGELSPQTQKIILIVAAVAAAVGPLLIIVGKIATGIGSIMNLISIIGPSIGALAGPIGIAVAIIAALITAGVLLYKNWDRIKAKATEIKANISATFTALKATIVGIFQGIKSTTISVWNGIKTAITRPIRTAVGIIRTAINKIKAIINGAKLKLPRFKLPHFSIDGGQLPWGIGGKGRKPTISVNWYKDGGIFDNASVIGVGEAGTEAVVPLEKLWTELEQRAGIDYNKLAAVLVSALAQVQVVSTTNLDGKTIAKETAPLIRKEINTIDSRNNRKLGYI